MGLAGPPRAHGATADDEQQAGTEEADSAPFDVVDEAADEAADVAVDVAQAWEEVAASHAAQRRLGAEERAKLREERKAHKKKIKGAQRAAREGALVAVLPAAYASPRTAAPGSSHKPRRASAREHRVSAQVDAWVAQLETLEAEFGVDLCGLSGLALARDPGAFAAEKVKGGGLPVPPLGERAVCPSSCAHRICPDLVVHDGRERRRWS